MKKQKRSRSDMTHSGVPASSCAETPWPSVEARVAAAALCLRQAGELDAVEALLKLVAGDAAASAAKPKKPSGRPRNTRWHAEAKHLRAQGFDLKAIAATLGRPPLLARWELDKNGERMRAPQRANASRSRRGAHYERHDEVVIRSKREIRAVLPPQEVKMAAIKSFAAGGMTADELRRVLSTYESQRPPRGDAAFHARDDRSRRPT
jgi:hypothetical protein